jgi:hypothetical protein
MSGKIYFGVSGVARKAKRMYVGQSSVARKIKRGYVGIGGVAHNIFSSDPIEKYGQATGLTVGRRDVSSAKVGSYAIFAGGYTDMVQATNAVDAYSSALVKSSPSVLTVAMGRLASASVGNYALFAGGYNASYSATNTVNAYNTSLTRSTPTVLAATRLDMMGASVGNYALFAGGMTNSGTNANTVYAYNASLTRSTPTVLTFAGAGKGASVGNYAIFVSENNTLSAAYNESLTRSTPASTQSRYSFTGISGSNYAIFVGGVSEGTGNVTGLAEVFSSSLVKSTTTSLQTPRAFSVGTNLNNNFIVAGGVTQDQYSDFIETDVVEVYSNDLTRSVATSLTTPRKFHAGSSVGNYALFAGGGNSLTSDLTSVEVYVNS